MIYKLIVIDDKPNVIEGIRTLTDWHNHDIEFVGSATNGVDALRLVEQIQPDIAITDISMPLMDGLAFTESALRIAPHLKIIVLSGYDQFEYAQRAIQLGVLDYLLKPVRIEQIVDAVQRAATRLNSELARNDELSTLRREQETAARSTLLREYLAAPVEARQSIAEQLGMDTCGLFTMLVAEPVQNFKHPDLIAFQDGMRMVGLCSVDQAGSRQIALQIMNCGHKPITVGIGTTCRGYEGVATSYQEAVAALDHQFFLGTGRIIMYSDLMREQRHSDSASANGYPERIERDLIVALRTGAEQQVLKLLDSFFEALQPDAVFQRAASLEFLAVAVHALTDLELLDGDENLQASRYAAQINQCTTLLQLKDAMVEILSTYIRRIERKRSSGTRSAVDMAREFIRENLNRDISLDDVAAVLHFTPGYLAHIFKKATGQTVVEYINRQKMERAAELLLNPQSKIGAIAQQVGYSDRRYFSELFRRHYDCTPSEYRDRFLAAGES